jgi:vacuolar protein sorting-associated protein 51
MQNLDSDMQMLVYENYNKFISATETIKRMKSNVEAMDGDMSDVREKMDTIAKTSTGNDQVPFCSVSVLQQY